MNKWAVLLLGMQAGVIVGYFLAALMFVARGNTEKDE